MKIVNLTQHFPTQEQLDAGVFNPEDWGAVKELLTFNSIPTRREILRRA